MGSDRVSTALELIERGYAMLIDEPFDTQSPPELLAVQSRLEALACKQPAIGHTLIARLVAQTSAVQLGAKSWTDVLCERLRISRADARQRLADAAELGPRTALTGEPLAPAFPVIAAAQAAGLIGTAHIREIGKFFDALPAAVDYQTRQECETTLVGVATEQTPDALRKAAHRLLALIHPDGDFSDTDRARKRGLTLGPQRADGLSEIRGLLSPEARATLEAVMTKYGAPGMCNPDDEHPCVDGAPTQAQIDNDTRTPAQRQHDALIAMGRSILASGKLGQHNGLPVTVVVSTTMRELESGAGQAVTATGTLLPMPTLIKMAAHAYHYLTIFDNHTGRALHLGRTRRIASPDQRIVLTARDRGCTKPGCTVAAANCQVHHLTDWADGGPTDIDNLTLACPKDNRSVQPGGWTTRKRSDGRTEWIPPPHLDTGQTRINDYHHPQNYLLPKNEQAADDEPEEGPPEQDTA
jgi:hypothetical protein